MVWNNKCYNYARFLIVQRLFVTLLSGLITIITVFAFLFPCYTSLYICFIIIHVLTSMLQLNLSDSVFLLSSYKR